MLTIDAIHLREIHLPLAYPFQTSLGVTTARRILLVEIASDGLTAWGECAAGEHPYSSEESIDTAWVVTENELAPRMVGKEVVGGGGVPELLRQVRGNRMAKAALENAVWDLEAQKKRTSLAALLGGTREVIACGVSIDIQPSPAALMEKIAEALEAGYQRITLECKPGWDTKIFEQVRKRWPELALSCDANSAYRVNDIDRIVEWDEFDLQRIEQPLWYDDFYFHSML
ncbi:MAG TPA: enolase C-terminal domain-like protein, partial [Acidobacteriaceae bacterium]|nr:enolase C-terminal domain-like protein [Acidobacteriaceae bacterium]